MCANPLIDRGGLFVENYPAMDITMFEQSNDFLLVFLWDGNNHDEGCPVAYLRLAFLEAVNAAMVSVMVSAFLIYRLAIDNRFVAG
jgi:hypothetical protein